VKKKFSKQEHLLFKFTTFGYKKNAALTGKDVVSGENGQFIYRGSLYLTVMHALKNSLPGAPAFDHSSRSGAIPGFF
jgi:hypothetical protein